MSGRISYYGGIVKNGLILDLDAGKKDSYISGNTKWNDISGNGNNGILTNGPIYNSYNVGSILFDGNDDYFNNNNQIADVMNTIDIWINMKTTSAGPIIYYGSDSFDSNAWTWGMAIFPSSTHGFNEAPLSYPTTSLYTDTVNVNVWKNFTLVRKDGSDVKLYKNGVLVGTKVGSGTISVRNSTDRLYIAKAGSTYSNFIISSVKIYNRALSAAEVLQNYNATKTRYL